MTDQETQAPRPVRNPGDLFTRCRKRWGLEPEEVLGLLGAQVTGTEEGNHVYTLGGMDLDQALARVEAHLTLRSGRVLKPEESISGWLDELERRAWENLAKYNFLEFGHLASAWVALNRITGANRRYPFGSAVALGRERAKGTAERGRAA